VPIFFCLQSYKQKVIYNSRKKYDLVIKYAQILDGSGEKEVFRGDLGIKDGV